MMLVFHRSYLLLAESRSNLPALIIATQSRPCRKNVYLKLRKRIERYDCFDRIHRFGRIAWRLAALAAGAGIECNLAEFAPRHAIITGFLGGLTTFSTFSLEVSTQLQQGRIANAGIEIMVHVVGSVLLTIVGIVIAQQVLRA